MRTVVLGLDLGTSCGYALIYAKTDQGIASMHGAWNCSFRRNVDSPAVRIEKFERYLRGILSVGVEKVYYENVRRHNGTQAAHVYGALRSKMMEVCTGLDISFEGIEVAQIKKFATGKGNASKELVYAQVVETWGFAVPSGSYDEADAIAIARCGWETRT